MEQTESNTNVEPKKLINKGRPYGRVLRRYDRSPKIPMRFASYDVSINSSAQDLDGVIALTLFFPVGKDVAAKRALKFGWIDETEKWNLQYNQNPGETHWSKLSWHEFRAYARAKGIDLSGKRPEIESRLIEQEKGE